jgi:hypothetical protein
VAATTRYAAVVLCSAFLISIKMFLFFLQFLIFCFCCSGVVSAKTPLTPKVTATTRRGSCSILVEYVRVDRLSLSVYQCIGARFNKEFNVFRPVFVFGADQKHDGKHVQGTSGILVYLE